MSRKLDSLLREESWRGTTGRVICTSILVTGIVWLPKIVSWMEMQFFNRDVSIQQEKLALLRILAGLFVAIIATREILIIRKLLTKP
jgi:hypothetical protein